MRLRGRLGHTDWMQFMFSQLKIVKLILDVPPLF
jgi:hypothetical protein